MTVSHRRLLLTLTLSTLFAPAALASSAQRASPKVHERRERWSMRQLPVTTVSRIPKEMVDEPLEFDTPTTGTAKIYHPHATAAQADADAAHCAPPEGKGAAFYPQSFGNVPSISAEAPPAAQPDVSAILRAVSAILRTAPKHRQCNSSHSMRRSPTPEARAGTPSPTPEARAGTPRSVMPTPEPRARTPAIYLTESEFPIRLSPAGIPQANSPPSGRLAQHMRSRQRRRSRYFEGPQSPEDQEVASASEAPKSSTPRVNSPAFVWPPAEVKVPSPTEMKAANERAKRHSPFRYMQAAEDARVFFEELARDFPIDDDISQEIARVQAEYPIDYDISQEEEMEIARVFQVELDDYAKIARVQAEVDDFDLQAK